MAREHVAHAAAQRNKLQPLPAKHQTGKKVAVVGSGPAGMAAAQQLARAGHDAPRFGALKPVGLVDPRTGRRPWAAVQLPSPA